jgi:branched-chain amino acid transport system substrate-binding protein
MKHFALKALCLLSMFAGAAPLLAADTPLKVGAILPLTGGASLYGTPCKNGIEMALSELAAEHPGEPALQFVFEDDAFQPAKTVGAFKKLLEQDRVEVMVSIASTPSNAVAPLADAKKIPLFSWASDTNVSVKRPTVVRTYPSGFIEGKMVGEYANELGYKTAAAATTINDYPESVRSGFVPVFGKSKVVLQEEFSPDTTDFRPFLTKLAKSPVDVLFLCLNPGSNSVFVRQLKDFRLSPRIAGCENINSMDEVKASNGGLVGAFFATAHPESDFRSRYRERFGNEDVISGAAVHYDLTRALDSFVRTQRAEGKTLPQGAAFIEALARNEIQARALGNFRVQRSSGDQYFNVPLYITEVTAEGFRKVKP